MGENGGKEESMSAAASAAFGLPEEDAVEYYCSSSSSAQVGLGLPPAKKKQPKRTSFDDDDFLTLLHGSDPFKIELNRLQNLVKGTFLLFFGSFFPLPLSALPFFGENTACSPKKGG